MRRMRRMGHVARIGDRRVLYSLLVGKPKRKRRLGKPSHRWENNIKIDLQVMRWEAWTGLIWLRIETGDGLL